MDEAARQVLAVTGLLADWRAEIDGGFTRVTDIVVRSILNPYFLKCRTLFTIRNNFFSCTARTIQI